MCENLRRIQGAPSVQMQPIAPDFFDKETALSKPEVRVLFLFMEV